MLDEIRIRTPTLIRISELDKGQEIKLLLVDKDHYVRIFMIGLIRMAYGIRMVIEIRIRRYMCIHKFRMSVYVSMKFIFYVCIRLSEFKWIISVMDLCNI